MLRCISRRHFVSAGLGFSLIRLLPRHASAGPAEFRTLTAKSGSASLLGKDGPRTEIWGYDGTVPGPVLWARRGDEIRIRLLNQLTQPTSIHWHGIRIEKRSLSKSIRISHWYSMIGVWKKTGASTKVSEIFTTPHIRAAMGII
jgi:hypothetical protein